MHGTDWNSVAVFMQTRNPDQCRNRYINNLDPTLDHSKLTIDEKKKVLELVDKLGVKKLKEVASHFPTRSPQMITNCYKVHQRKQKKDATRI
jgi:Myb-like DNA-binding protein FlbD